MRPCREAAPQALTAGAAIVALLCRARALDRSGRHHVRAVGASLDRHSTRPAAVPLNVRERPGLHIVENSRAGAALTRGVERAYRPGASSAATCASFTTWRGPSSLATAGASSARPRSQRPSPGAGRERRSGLLRMRRPLRRVRDRAPGRAGRPMGRLYARCYGRLGCRAARARGVPALPRSPRPDCDRTACRKDSGSACCSSVLTCTCTVRSRSRSSPSTSL